MRKNAVYLLTGLVAAGVCLMLPTPAGLSPAGQSVAAVAVLMAVWWMTQAIPLAATSLVPLVCFPLLGVMSMSKATAPYANHLIFLFMGGFMIAAAIEKVELHRRFALWTIFAFGTRPASVVAGFMASTGFISMWISNSATVMMMMPIATATMTALSMHSAQGTTPDEGQAADAGADRSGFNRALLLGITYSASIGGVATLIGSPPNTIAAGVLENTFQMQVSFARWMAVGTPLALVLLPLTWLYLVKIAHKMPASGLDDRAVFRRMLDEMGPMSAAEKRVLAVFTVVSACWVSRGFFDIEALRHVNDSTIAIAGALALFMMPAGSAPGPILDWESAERIPWGILLLFGGGLSLAEGVDSTGLAQWIGNQVSTLHTLPYFVFVLCIVGTITFLTEFTSNTAIAAVFAPIVAGICASQGLEPFGMLFAVAVAAAFAFMLPVATPPNAIVFSTGQLKVRDMASVGFVMNIVTALILTAAVALVLPLFG